MNPSQPSHYLADIQHRSHEPENTRTLARLVWAGILGASILAICGAVVFGIWELTNALKILNVDEEMPAASTNSLDQKRLKATIEDFNSRRAHFELAKSATSSIQDPSR